MKNKVQKLFLIGFMLFFCGNINAQWKKLKGTSKISIRSMAVDSTTIFVGTHDNGVLVSNDNGATWNASEKGLPKGNCKDLDAIVISKSVIYAGGCHGVYLSYDNGLNWEESSSDLNTAYIIIHSMAISGSTIFAGAYGDGVFLSSDNGKKWTKCKGITDRLVTSLAVSEKNIFAGTNTGGVFFSSDNGATWKPVNKGLPAATSIKSLAVCDTTIFAGTDGGGVNVFTSAPEGNGVYVSIDNGANWFPANVGIENKTVQSLSTSGNNVFAVLKNGKLFLSKDLGKSWIDLSIDFPKDTFVNSVVMNGANIFVGTDNGIYKNTGILK